ncbi:MAG TPA: universal stress protein [Actinomycetota bacterium]|nr:universal stress protein [Actinomycetota bacterium]
MYNKILIATDGSPTAQKAAARGSELARDVGAEVIYLSVGDPAEKLPVAQQAAETFGEGLTVTPLAVEGHPADVICAVAQERGVDLIVVGNRGMTETKLLLLGNVPNQVSHHAPCNLLIVKTT